MAPRFPQSWVDQVYAASRIVDLAGAYLPLQKKGRRYWGLCPFHNEKTASFSVNPELNLYYCFGCKASGNIAQFAMEMEKLTYPEALLHLAKQFNVPPPPVLVEDPEEERRRSQRERLVEATREAAQFYHDQLWLPDGGKALDYLHGRGLDDAVIRRFGIGYSPDEWDALMGHLSGKGFTLQEQQLAALVTVKESSRYDTFRDRVMFPIISRYGQPIGFGARALGDAQPKYLNTADSLIFNKRHTLYGVNQLKRQRNLEQLLLVEGYMDVVALSQSGIQNAVATLGTSLTVEQARMMKGYAPEVWIAYDGDEPGQTAALRALNLFDQEGIPAKVLHFPEGEDPDELIRRHGAEAFRAVRPMPGMAFRLKRLELQHDMGRDEDKREFAKQACGMLRSLREPVEVDYYLGRIHLKTGIPKDVLAAQMRSGKRPEPEIPDQGTARRQNRQEDGRSPDQSEFILAALLVSGLLPKDFALESDFEDERLRRVVAASLQGKSPSAILEEAEDEQERSFLGDLFNRLPDQEKEDALSAAEDCLRVLRVNKLNARIQKLSEEAVSQEGEQRALTLRLIRELQNEMNRQNRHLA